ncbi:hypothetical protein [Ruegeria sp. A3M17]|uniref:hypothetical protein n=1 Tax=Ruegeria sp. A3M17 TaxID=2267229 RepID=UPI000DFD73B8|nr:hypothetical protein [Ruegeria sp. A3M17]RBW58724.1 hypothetical protein DS906_07940 [Ruegeria sp. A3M17]
MKAHLGNTIAGFPNFFILLGPHSGLGHNSVVPMIKAQVRHIGRVLDQMGREGLQVITPRPENQEAFEREMRQQQIGGCASGYQDAQGRNTTLWPGTVSEYEKRMAQSGLEQYRPTLSSGGER